MPSKLFTIVFAVTVPLISLASISYSQSVPSESKPVLGPTSLEPAIEKDGVLVALRTVLQKKDQLSVLVKISNLSEKPILVSPDAVEATTEEGFVMKLAGSELPIAKSWQSNPEKKSSWDKFTQVAALIPFSDPYRIISTTTKLAKYASQSATALSQPSFNTPTSRRGLLHEVILQPGMATHGLIIYDASMLKAFDYSPTLRIKVMVGEEPFEFKFASQPENSGGANLK